MIGAREQAATLAGVLPADSLTQYIQQNIDKLSIQDMHALNWRLGWLNNARPKQLPPPGEWTVWLLLAGRGFGKTRVGAEHAGWWAWENPGTRTHVIGPTSSDVRDVIFEGESGFLNVIPQDLIKDYHRSLNELILVNGSRIKGFSSEEPQRLRGPQCHFAWCDELAAWGGGNMERMRDTWDMMNFGLRLGDRPQIIVTTTPKPVELVVELMEAEYTYITSGSTYENRDHLAPSFFKQITQYEGTELGRQEIHAEVLDPEESGIIKRNWFKLWPSHKPLPTFHLVVQSYDTAFTDKTHNDPTAQVTLGVFYDEESQSHNVMVVDAWDEHIDYATLKPRVIKEYNTRYGEKARRADFVLIEEKGSGIALMRDLRESKVPARSYNPGRADKTQRLHAISHYVCNGYVWLPESQNRRGEPRDWLRPLIRQLCSFPLVSHDDYVDAFSQGLRLLGDQGWLLIEQADDPDEEDIDEDDLVLANPYAQ